MQAWKDRVFQFRVRRKLSQAQLAEMMGVSESTVRRWEQGKTLPQKMHEAILTGMERASE